MGCKESKDGDGMRVEEEWAKRNLPEVSQTAFENKFEVLLYMTLNLIRNDPQWAIPFIKNVKHHKHYTGGNIESIVGILRNAKNLPIMEISLQGISACRKANDEI